MKAIFCCIFFVALFISPAGHFSGICANRNKIYKKKIDQDDVSVSSTYLKDGDNNEHNYGARYTLTNNTGVAKTIHWVFASHSNVQSSSGGFSGDQYLIGYGQATIVTFTQVDPNQAWSVSAPTISW